MQHFCLACGIHHQPEDCAFNCENFPKLPPVPIEEIAANFQRDVLPHIMDLVYDDPDNQFEGYVFAYILAHRGWNWDNSRDAGFLELFSNAKAT